MELWIRSQDKESLLLIKKVFYHCTCDEMESLGEHYIGNKEWVGDKDYTLLGKYKTKERALEVLDKIQKYILLPNVIDNSAYVYEMPKE